MKTYFKRACAAVLTMMLILSFYTVLGSESESEFCSLNNGEIGLLKKLGIITSEHPDFSAEVKRGELAYIMTRFCNIEVRTDAEPKAVFYDLTTDHRYFSQINECIIRGIFSGDGTGYFRPEDTATINEACKVFLAASGYDFVGYIGSYMDLARTSGILRGVDTAQNLTLGVMAKMAHNSLHAGMVEAVSYGKEMNYRVSKAYTVIEHYHDMKQSRGILDGFYGTTLAMPDRTVAEDKVLIDGQRYTCDKGNQLIGRNIVFYTNVHDESGAPQIEYIYADEDKNTELSIKSEDMQGKLGDTIVYYSGNREQKVSFLNTGDVIINGVSYPEYVDSDFLPDFGTITLIDNNNDDVFEVAIIDDIDFMVVGAIDSQNKIIYDKNDQSNVLGSKTNDDVALRLLKGNVEAHMSIVSVDSAVAVQKSRNTSGIVKIDVRIPDSTVSGLINGIGDEHITIDDKEYMLAANAVYDETASIGDVVDLSIFDDYIGVVTHKKDGYMYGYLADAQKDNKGLNARVLVKLITSNLKPMTYECITKLKVDESVQENTDNILSILSTSAASTYQQYSTSSYSQPIRYKLTADGEVSHIDTLIYNPSVENTDSLQLDKGYSVHRYYASSHSFYSEEVLAYAMAATTTVMIVPRRYRADDEWYSSGFSNNGNYIIEAFNVDEFSCSPKLLIAYSSAGERLTVSGGAQPYIVTEVRSSINDEGNIVKKIKVVGASANPIERDLNERVSNIDLSVGDVVRFNGGKNGDIVAIEKIVQAGQVPETRLTNYGTTTGPAFQSQVRCAYGTIVAYKDGLMIHTTSISDDDDGVEGYADRNAYRVKDTIPVWIYTDAKKPMVRSGLWSDIIPYEANKAESTRAFIYTASGALQFVYICK